MDKFFVKYLNSIRLIGLQTFFEYIFRNQRQKLTFYTKMGIVLAKYQYLTN